MQLASEHALDVLRKTPVRAAAAAPRLVRTL